MTHPRHILVLMLLASAVLCADVAGRSLPAIDTTLQAVETVHADPAVTFRVAFGRAASLATPAAADLPRDPGLPHFDRLPPPLG